MTSTHQNKVCLASLREMKTEKYRAFVEELDGLATNHGLITISNSHDAWVYPWLWFNGLENTAWRGKKVVAIRCGASPLPWYLAGLGAEVILVDYDSHGIDSWAAARDALGLSITWVIVDDENIPLPDGMADLVCCYSAISRMTRKEVAVGEAVRVLKDGGMLAASFDVCEPEMAMSFPEWGSRWNGNPLSTRQFQELLWFHPAFDNEAAVDWNYADCKEFIAWHKQINLKNNYTVGAALLCKAGNEKRQIATNEIPEKMIFLHIPKTAGETFNRMLRNTFSDHHVFWINPFAVHESFMLLHAIETTEPGRISIITGHASYGFHHSFPNQYKYVTILREPVKRVLSYLDYVYFTPEHPRHQMLRDQPDIDFTSNPFSDELSNLQTRMIAGFHNYNVPVPRSQLEIAKQRLKTFAAVGIAEEFDSFISFLNEKFGWQLSQIPSQNVTSKKRYRDKVTSDNIDQIKKQNELDADLYEFAKDLFHQQFNDLRSA